MAYIDFDTFASVELRIGVVESVEDHPNADRLYVVEINEGDDQTRTVCAGLKDTTRRMSSMAPILSSSPTSSRENSEA